MVKYDAIMRCKLLEIIRNVENGLDNRMVNIQHNCTTT